jgi:hypothetical protein
MPALEFKGQVIGELKCEDCGWEHAQVRNNRKGMPWVYCDSCRSQHQTRDKKGADGLRKRMRALTISAPVPSPAPTEDPLMAKAKTRTAAQKEATRRMLAANQAKAKSHEKIPARRAGEKNEAPAKTKGRDLWNDDFLGVGPDHERDD